MKIVICILCAIILVLLVVFIIGLCLPKKRTLTKVTIYHASAEDVYNIVIDNHNWKYRTSLDDLRIVETDGDFEVWDEISNGFTIRFRTTKKIPCSFYSFEMKSSMFTGYWQAEFETIENGETRFTTAESIDYKNPLIRVIGYAFMNLDKFMETYQNDLRKKLDQ